MRAGMVIDVWRTDTCGGIGAFPSGLRRRKWERKWERKGERKGRLSRRYRLHSSFSSLTHRNGKIVLAPVSQSQNVLLESTIPVS